jgi:hypothetical protein
MHRVAPSPASLPGLTRQPIFFEQFVLQGLLDARVKPAHPAILAATLCDHSDSNLKRPP